MKILKRLVGGMLLLSMLGLAGCPYDWYGDGHGRGRGAEQRRDGDRGDRRGDDEHRRGGDDRSDDRPH
jgi:hypothetical protein